MLDFFKTILYDPLYNGLIFFVEHVPGADVGLAVIALTVCVRLVIFPLSLKAVRTNMAMQTLTPELERIKKEYKDDRQAQAQKTMELYKEAGVNPFASILFLFIQIPIIISLYLVFLKGGLPEINTELLYSFIPAPEYLSMDFLGLIDLSGRSVILALTAGLSQFIQARLSLPAPEARKKDASLGDDLKRSMQFQMRYVLPIIITVVAYTISAAVALYWTASNIFTIGQEIYVRKRYRERGSLGQHSENNA